MKQSNRTTAKHFMEKKAKKVEMLSKWLSPKKMAMQF